MPAVPRLPRPVVRAVLLLLLLALLPAGPGASAATRPPAAPVVTTSPATGPAGSTTTLQGRGFAARTSGTLLLGPAAVPVRTDGKGAFSAAVTVPRDAAGPLAVTARVGALSAATTFLVTVPTAQPRLRFGVATPGGPTASEELDAVAAVAGEAPTIVLSYADFTRELDVTGLRSVAARGAVPLVTWEPWAAGSGVTQPAYALDRIAAGDHDPYLRRWAEGLRSYGSPVLLRFAHEMNGSWYPWSEGVNGNGPGDYVAAWHHVRAVVTGAGASNVSWVWSPNVPYPGSLPLAGLYPGADAVDVVALDGYNFGTSQADSGWVEPQALFGPGLQELRRLAPGLPVVIAETASAELGGSKAAWIRAAVAYLAAQPDVTAFVWFHHLKETDWRLDSSAASAAAVREALAARRSATAS